MKEILNKQKIQIKMITTTLERNAFSLCRIARAPRPNPSATKFSGKEETGNERCAEEDFSVFTHHPWRTRRRSKVLAQSEVSRAEKNPCAYSSPPDSDVEFVSLQRLSPYSGSMSWTKSEIWYVVRLLCNN